MGKILRWLQERVKRWIKPATLRSKRTSVNCISLLVIGIFHKIKRAHPRGKMRIVWRNFHQKSQKKLSDE
jgi:hypothetical protein